MKDEAFILIRLEKKPFIKVKKNYNWVNGYPQGKYNKYNSGLAGNIMGLILKGLRFTTANCSFKTKREIKYNHLGYITTRSFRHLSQTAHFMCPCTS